MPNDAVIIRPADQPGDLGWVIMAHGEIYAQEYSWNTDFEALVATIVADYASDRDPTRNAAWIAEVGRRRAGCIFCLADDDRNSQAARLRILLVDPAMRGRGIGARLVDTCLDYARQAGYTRITLWTNDVLIAARKIYQSRGFKLIEQAPHHSFGHDLVGQYWSRDLISQPPH